MRALVLSSALLALLIPAPAHASSVEVTLEPASVSVVVGGTFTVRATIGNPGSHATESLLAHLDVVSLTGGVYVDPEDWSSSRTLSVSPIASGSSASVSWEVKAVNAGRFDLHVVVLPVLDGRAGAVSVSTPTYATVTAYRPLNPGGSVLVVLGVPVVLTFVAVSGRIARRRRTD